MVLFEDLRLRTRWKSASDSVRNGPLLLSFTQFTPHRLRDLYGIWRAAESLGDRLVAIEGAVGVLTYFQPAGRHVGSLSAWTGEEGLRRFVALLEHREIMRRYRPRGLPLRSAKWWANELDLDAALAQGQAELDGSAERRVHRERGALSS